MNHGWREASGSHAAGRELPALHRQGRTDAGDEAYEVKASGKVRRESGKRRGECRRCERGLHALDCGSASYAREWERHQDGFWIESAAGTGKNREADHEAADARRAERGYATPSPAIAQAG